MEHVVMKHRRTTLERAEKFISSEFFTDVNLFGRLYPKKHPVKSIKHWAAPQGKYMPYEEAVKGDYSEVKLGEKYGPTWATHWFLVDIDLPAEWVGLEVLLKWNSGSEAMVWVSGQPKQGLSAGYDRLYYPLTEKASAIKLSYTVYIEMACNEMFGAGEGGLINPTNPNRYFTLNCCEAVVFDRQVYRLIRDVEFLYNTAKHLGAVSNHGYQALYAVNEMINACDVTDKSTYQKCYDIAEKFRNQKNGDGQHTIHAMGHSHIDTAWLWPYGETIRKCARSWSCTIRLLEKYPDFIFTCSQAQQYEWVKERYPGLYAEIKKFVKSGQFVPVGGSWVEMDGNIPSGEGFVRQFLYGQRFFKKEFGITCKEFWLPDTFGYSAQLPQIMRHCGMIRFLTQKLSWNLVNKFPHHTFWWEGIDGSRVLAHFPPGDNYCMEGKVEELLKTANNFQDKGRSNSSCYLFGHGDGGNGPTADMLERLKRAEDVDGLPRVKLSSPDEYFSHVEQNDGRNLCRWAGELYLELHNGTYTTQALVKKMNRKCEFLLRDVEFLSSAALFAGADKTFQYPSVELARLWKLLLLNQFHDVLPGSSITLVYEDAHRHYEDIVKSATLLRDSATKAVTGTKGKVTDLAWNTLGWERLEVITMAAQGQGSPGMKKRKTEGEGEQTDSRGHKLVSVKVPSYGYSVLNTENNVTPVTVSQKDNVILMKNEHLTTSIDSHGRVVSLCLADQSYNLIDSAYPANQFVMFDDIPLYWDAWDVMDYHLETRKPVSNVIDKARIIDRGPLRATVQVSLRISESSTIKQTIILDAGCPYIKFETEVSWHENRKFLKVEFPTSLHSREVTYEIQYGHLQRPNHFNTSWDSARFEVCGHKWADMSEYGRGVAVLNDSKYGYSAFNNVLRLSLLRSPKAPDEKADMGTHTFTYAMMPHNGSFQDSGVIEAAYNLNNPLFITQQVGSTSNVNSFFQLDSHQVVLETVKKAEDRDDCLILRLYESFGGHCQTTLCTALPFKAAGLCSGLEEPIENDSDLDLKVNVDERSLKFKVKPFQIVSIMLQMW